jgi:PKD repeat protein
VLLDGVPIGNRFTPFASSPTESYARLRITQGTHTLTSDSGLLAYVYGYGSDPDDPFADVPAISYGYPAGASLDDAPPAFTATSLAKPVNGEYCLESTIDFIVTNDPFVRTWRWDFGDGATASGPTASHKYSSAGTYTITLIADRACYSDTLTRPITLVVPQAPAITEGCNCNAIQLRASDGFSSYQWSTGDTTQAISVTATGDYTLTATTAEGCPTASTTYHVDIGPAAPLQIRMVDPNPIYAAGQTVPIALEIKASPADDRCGDTHDSVTFALRFNRTLLTPPYIEGTSIIHDTIVGIDRILTIRTSADTTLLLELVAALGNVESTLIVLDSLGWDSCLPAAQAAVLGQFQLSGICREGGVRLFEANDELFIKPVRPDPAVSVAEIEYGIVEPGWTEISLVNSVGQRVLLPAAGVMLPGRYLLSLDVSQLPSGTYHCVLRTRTQQIERSVRVVK